MRRTDLYVVGGARVPSVTEVLHICGLTDFSGIPPGTLEYARERGVAVDEWITLLVKGFMSRDVKPDEWIAGYIEAFLSFEREMGLDVVRTQNVVVHPFYHYAGTSDIEGFMRKSNEPARPYVIDVKCVALLSPATRLQLAGYGCALDYARSPLPSGRGYHGRASLQLKSDGTYKLKRAFSDEDDHDWFAANRTAHFKLRHGLACLEAT